MHLKIFYFPFVKIGGAERVHLEILKSLEGPKIVFFTSGQTEFKNSEFTKQAFCLPFYSRHTSKIAKAINFLSHFVPVTAFGSNNREFYDCLPYFNSNVKKIDLTHLFYYNQWALEKYSLPYVSLLGKRITINNRSKEEFRQLYAENKLDPELANRFRIIPNGIQINPFNSDWIPCRLNNFTIGFVARNSPEKHPELSIRLVKNLEGKAKGLMLTDLPLQSVSGINNLEYHIGISDPQQLRKYFLGISVLIIPSEREGLPMVLMDAMEMGIPVISSNVGSVSEHIKNGVTGFLIANEEDFVSVAEKYLMILTEDKSLYETMSINCRSHAEKYFSMENFINAYRELFVTGA